MEIAILLFCVTLGLFSIFASYSLATVLYDNFIHRFLFAAIFSISAGTLNLTTWEITTRAQILIFFPFLIYLVFQIIKLKIKFALLFILTALLLLATHHFVYLTLFYSVLIVISALGYKLFKGENKYSHMQKTQFRRINFNYVYILIVFLLIVLIFLFGTRWGLITAGSRYAWIITIVMIAGRNVGFHLATFSRWSYISCSQKKQVN